MSKIFTTHKYIPNRLSEYKKSDNLDEQIDIIINCLLYWSGPLDVYSDILGDEKYQSFTIEINNINLEEAEHYSYKSIVCKNIIDLCKNMNGKFIFQIYKSDDLSAYKNLMNIDCPDNEYLGLFYSVFDNEDIYVDNDLNYIFDLNDLKELRFFLSDLINIGCAIVDYGGKSLI